MPKKSSVKSLATEVDLVQTTAPVVENVVAPVEVEKKEKVKKSKKSESVKQVSPVVDANVVIETNEIVSDSSVVISDTAVVAPETDTAFNEQSVEFLSKLQQLSVLLSSVKVEYRLLEKKWIRELKVAQKQSSRRKRKSTNRSPSGFVKPTKISDELANFLGKETGAEMARTDVTREINAYIRANKLQDAENGRKINPDTKLTDLLKLSSTDELTYFNLQKYMSPHFEKAVKKDAVVV
jgi:upstream activation factor subunit UAF30